MKPTALPTDSARVRGEFRIQRRYTRTCRRGSGTSVSRRGSPGKIVPQTGTASGAKCASDDSVRQQQRRVNVAVNHTTVDQTPEKVSTDISLTPLSQRTIVLDVDQTFRAGAIQHQYNNWLNLTSDKFILQTITGARLEFEEPPNQTCSPHPLKF